MAQLVVRNLEEDVRDRLREQAVRHARSMEEEVREILRSAVLTAADRTAGGPSFGQRLGKLYETLPLNGEPFGVDDLRGGPPQPAAFKDEPVR